MTDHVRAAVEKRAVLHRALRAWFKREARDLPWRRSKEPYAVWLSEIILQQTRVDQGTPYFERFINTFPNVQALAAAREDDVLKAWEGLGYYSRARNLHKAARIIARERQGAFPDSAAEWQSLPGVGPYTAGAIASIALDEAVPVVDGNVIRVLTRLFNIDQDTGEKKTRDLLWRIAEVLVPSRRPGDFNQALMELGARICTPKLPDCAACPIRNHCESQKEGVETERPVRKAKGKTPHHEMVAGVLRKNGRYLIAQRPSRGLLGGLWEFPAGRVQAGETHQQALERTFSTDFGLDVDVGKLIATVSHAYTHFRVTMTVYTCRHRGGTLTPATHAKIKWALKSQFSDHAFPKVNHKFLALL